MEKRFSSRVDDKNYKMNNKHMNTYHQCFRTQYIRLSLRKCILYKNIIKKCEGDIGLFFCRLGMENPKSIKNK